MTAYEVSFDQARLQLEVIHGFLKEAYWSKGIPEEVVARAIEGSLCVGAYAADGRQVGFARLVTDRATFGYLADVFVLPEHRGAGLSRAMVKAILDLPEVQAMRRLSLVTRDAHGVYAKLGFTPLANPEGYMELHRRDVYASGS